MNTELAGDKPLSRDALFRMFAEEACRDGILEDYELKILLNLGRFLQLTSEEAQQILRESRDRYKQGMLGQQVALEPRMLYQRVVFSIYADGQVDPEEERMLVGLRELLEITEKDHELCLQAIPQHLRVPQTEVKADEIKKDVPLPPPGSTTGHLASRLEHDAQKAWFRDHCNWHMLQERASAETRQAWRRFLNGMLNLSENEIYQALDNFDDILQPLNTFSVADVLIAVGVLRWSRVLLRTTFAEDEKAPARAWPGESSYERLAMKMSPILITVDYLHLDQGIEQYGGMALIHLFEDLCMVIERRHAEPITHLGDMIRMLFRVITKSEVTHRAAALISPLLEMAQRQGGAVLNQFVALCRAITEVEPKNHPLVIAADKAIREIDAKRSRFPKDFHHSDNHPSFNQGYETAMQRLDRLIAEIEQKNAGEASLIRALQAADLSEIDKIADKIRASCAEEGLDSKILLNEYLVATVLKDLPDYPRPVVAFFALGEAGRHHEELKGGWIQVLLKAVGEGRVQVIPDFPLFPSTSFLSVSMSEVDAGNLKRALDKSGGAYDVALVDPGRTGARIWHQVGDLDVTGNLFKVERKLMQEDNAAETVKCLDEALAAQPWLSRALIYKGLVAKRAGDLNGARQAFEKAIAIQPHDPVAIARLGVLEKNEDKLERSDELLLKSLQILPCQPSAMVTLAANMLGRLAGDDSSALPIWDYYVGGLHAGQGNGPDYQQLREISAAVDPGLAVNSRVVPVDTVFYL